jgi:hypothetical protein
MVAKVYQNMKECKPTCPQHSVSYFKFHMTNSVNKILYSSYMSFTPLAFYLFLVHERVHNEQFMFTCPFIYQSIFHLKNYRSSFNAELSSVGWTASLVLLCVSVTFCSKFSAQIFFFKQENVKKHSRTAQHSNSEVLTKSGIGDI